MKLKKLVSSKFRSSSKKKTKKSQDGDVPMHSSAHDSDKSDNSNDSRYTDPKTLFKALRLKATQLTKSEPFMTPLLKRTILHPRTNNFNSAISRIVASRLLSSCGDNPFMCNDILYTIIYDAMKSNDLEYGHTMSEAVAQDILACKRRDPACETELEVVLFYKGFASLVCHRAARRHYAATSESLSSSSSSSSTNNDRRFVSLWLQSQASAAFGVDIHPAAEIGAGVFFDHATGLVIGETAKVGDNCTILHGVTLGGTGKDAGDRHPKVGDDVLIGAGTSILGNIKIGNGAKIGAGSIVLKPVPHGATAVGAPAKIIGWAMENKPGSDMDMSLNHIVTIGEEEQEEESDTDSTSSTQNMTDESTHDPSNAKKKGSRRGISQSFTGSMSTKDLIPSSVSEEKLTRSLNRTSSNMCIFRMLSSKVPNALSYKQLRDVMKETCSEDEIGEVYMELLKKDPSKNYVSKCEVLKHFEEIVKKFTRMDSKELENVEVKLSKRHSIM